jgi:hypothetical protein
VSSVELRSTALKVKTSADAHPPIETARRAVKEKEAGIAIRALAAENRAYEGSVSHRRK